MSVSHDGNHNSTDQLLHAFLFVQPPTDEKTAHELLTSQTNFAHNFSTMNQLVSHAKLSQVLLRGVLLLEDGHDALVLFYLETFEKENES